MDIVVQMTIWSRLIIIILMIALNKGLALAVTALIVAAAIYHSAPALTNLTEDS